ncbi:MAG: hypothetical protein Terrestrivirus3_96 [Terrestrivirus sp.]|uniref:Uncharacterized protein n=1 Tax=Terrestrivirus sp. TaxID=2487775 RepID=A0A3G4ZLV5_9VIRU|nr:MAG: hypothetical protein Terrestrivirus3_96 [Terrestrivirus sp.]
MYTTNFDVNDFEIIVSPDDMEIIKEISPTINTYNITKIIDSNKLDLKLPCDEETTKKFQAILLLLLAGYYYDKINHNIPVPNIVPD